MYFCAANWVTSVTNLKTVDKGEHALTSKDKAGMASRMRNRTCDNLEPVYNGRLTLTSVDTGF